MAMGILDVVKRLPQILKARQSALDCIQDIDRCICIDAPDFHLPILKKAKTSGILSIGIVSPQIWAWRPGRASKIAKKMDRLLCLFDFEPGLYPKDFDARFVGHPLINWTEKRTDFVPNTFALFPGSRPQEIRRHLNLFIKSAISLQEINPSARFLLSVPKNMTPDHLPPFIKPCPAGSEIAQNAQAALSKSGTITLELACMGVPIVVAHRVHPITYLLGRLLIKGIKHIALPNILSEEMVVPEFIQPNDPKMLANCLLGVKQQQNINLKPLTSKNPIQDMLKSIIW
jgi:lipid-A-disaccharide synthase